MEFLTNVDMSKAVDSNASMCPKCGAEIPEEASECPKCGVDPATGQLSASAKKRARKGVDPAEFYTVVWKNAWEFTKTNRKTVQRIAVYLLVFSLINGLCGFMVGICKPGTPPQMFWVAFGFAASMLTPGLIWAMTLEIIQATVTKKASIKDVNIDMFQNIALGIKTLLVSIAWFPIGYIMYPLAMIHMAMPVTKKAWFWPAMVPIFLGNLGETLYYWVIVLVVNLPLLIAGGIFAALFGSDLLAVVNAASQGKEVVVGTGLIVTAAIIAVFNVLWFAFASMFTMRVIGLIAYYCRDQLELVTLVAEKTYVKKVVQLDPFGNPIKTRAKKVQEAIVAVVVLIVVGAVGYYAWYTMFRPAEG
jgi:ribosomal protein L40E